MDDDREDMGEDGAARAFAQLGREVSLLRAAIEGLTAARDAIEIPDYEPTLERTEKILVALVHQIDGLAKKPAMTLTPETMGQRLNASVADATAELRNLVNSTRGDMSAATRDLQGMARSWRTRDQQDRWLYGVGFGGILAGLLIYALLGGPIIRATPDSWGLPEGMATRVLGAASPWEAGQRLMRYAAPASWDGIVSGNRIVTANKDTLEGCQRAAAKAKKAVRCTIDVKVTE
jgi:hypothetical protein